MQDIILVDGELETRVIQQILEIEKSIKILNDTRDVYKRRLTDLMEEHNVQFIENDFMKIVFYPENEKQSLNSNKIRKEYPEVYVECVEKSKVKPFIKITMK